MSEQTKPKNQDYIGLALCAVGGLSAVSLYLSAFGGQAPNQKVEMLMAPVEFLGSFFGTIPAMLFSAMLIALGVWAFMETKPVALLKPFLLAAGTTFGLALIAGGLGSFDALHGGDLGQTVRISRGLSGHLLPIFLGVVALIATFRPSLFVPRTKLPDLDDLGLGGAKSVDAREPSLAELGLSEPAAVTAAETELLAAPPKKHPAAPPRFEDVRLDGGIPEGAKALEGDLTIERAAPAPIRSESLSKTVEENPDVKPLEDEVSVEPSWMGTGASWEAPEAVFDVEEEVVSQSETAWSADPDDFARTVRELEESTSDEENPFAVDLSEAYADQNDPMASAAQARKRWFSLTERSARFVDEGLEEPTEAHDEESGAPEFAEAELAEPLEEDVSQEAPEADAEADHEDEGEYEDAEELDDEAGEYEEEEDLEDAEDADDEELEADEEGEYEEEDLEDAEDADDEELEADEEGEYEEEDLEDAEDADDEELEADEEGEYEEEDLEDAEDAGDEELEADEEGEYEEEDLEDAEDADEIGRASCRERV